MKVEVRFFARCREVVGEKVKELEVEEGMKLQDFIDLLLTRYPELRKVRLIVSRNHNYAPLNEELKEHDELAVFPPVSGG
jgi:molybdopterin synthase sulfur carrier subunit